MADGEVMVPEVVDPKESNEPVVDAFVSESMEPRPDEGGGDGAGVSSRSVSTGRMPKEVRKMFADSKAEAVKRRIEGVSEEELGKLLESCGGFYSVVARKLGLSSDAVEKRVRKSAYLQSIKKTIDEGMKDLAVNELTKAMKRGEAWAITFYLKCKGGWRENPAFNVDADGTAERAISFNLIPLATVNAAKEAHVAVTEGNEGVV